jgi:hypothetical protein
MPADPRWAALAGGFSAEAVKEGSGMRRLARSLVLFAVMLSFGFLAAGCGHSGAGGAAGSFSPSRSISVPSRSASFSATATAQPSAAQSATAPAPAAQPSSSPASGSGSSSSLIWLWVGIGAVVLIGIIVLVARSSRRRSAAASGWRSRVIDAYAKGSAVYDAMSAAETPAVLAASDAAARWSEIQRRADDLTQALYALREAAPAEDDRARVADVLHWLQAVRSGMDAERSPGGANGRQAEVVRSRLRSFEAALRALQAPVTA